MTSKPSVRERLGNLGRGKSNRRPDASNANLPPKSSSTEISRKRPDRASVPDGPSSSATKPQNGNTAMQPSGDPNRAVVDGNNTDEIKLQTARDALWKAAYEQLRRDKAELITAYEKLIAAGNNLGDQPVLTPENATAVAQKQRDRMESRAWMYPWFGRTKQVRNTVDKIFNIVQQSAGLISTGMTMAPVYVSLPWSFIAILIPFIMNDSKERQAALDGLEKVTGIMATYRYTEEAYLTDNATQSSFVEIVTEVYVAILEYQASAAIYFAQSTLKRLGLSLVPANPWNQAFESVKYRDGVAQNALRGLGESLMHRQFQSIGTVLQESRDFLDKIYRDMSLGPTISREQIQKEQILNWICAKNISQDHFNVEDKVGPEYLSSGTWLLEDKKQFLPWLQSKNGAVLLQGIVGSGKSSLTCMVINHLAAVSDYCIAFVYFSNNTAGSPDHLTQNRTRDILRQLLKQSAYDSSGKLAESIKDAYDCCENHSPNGWDMNLGTTITCLQSVLEEHSSDTYAFVFDALDELSDKSEDLTEFLSVLSNIKTKCSNLKIFMSARFGVNVPEALNAQQIPIGDSSSSDVIKFIATEVERRYKATNFTPEQAERLKTALERFAEGMFRWVELEIDLFLPRSSYQARIQMSQDIDVRLSNLEKAQPKPVDRLYDAYGHIWTNALGDDDETVRQAIIKSAIKWVLCSVRPLACSELVEAASIQRDGERYSIGEELLLGYCSNLIVKDSSDVIRLSHISVRQFFETKMRDEFDCQHQNQHAFDICMAMINVSGDFRSSNPPKTSMYQRAMELEAVDFEVYTFFNWPSHFKASITGLELRCLQRHRLNIRLRGFIQFLASTTKTYFDEVAESFTQTEASLILIVESFLHSCARTGWTYPEPILLRRLIRLVDSQVTILTEFGISATELAFLLGAEHFLQLSEMLGEIRSVATTGPPLYANSGYFERLQALSKFLSGDLGLQDPNPSCPSSKAERTTPARPTLIFEANERECTLCKLDEWVEGSRFGKISMASPSFEELSRASQAGCELCSSVVTDLHSKTGNLDACRNTSVSVRVILDIDCVAKTGRDVIRYSIPEVAEVEFEFCLTEASSSGKLTDLVQGRNVNPCDLAPVRGWLEDCNENHFCSPVVDFEGELQTPAFPTRLIYVGDATWGDKPRLCDFGESSSLNYIPFVILSYNWGSKQYPLLTRSSFEHMLSRIELNEIPTLHQDAIRVCQQLGYKYLWIDALCIMQDSHEDWSRESGRMGSYLASADLVLASSTAGALESLLPTKRAPIIKEYSVHLANEPDDSCKIGLRRPSQKAGEVLNQSILNRRWRIQESLLTRRLLIFGQEQIYWVCRKYFASQSTATRQSSPLTTFPSIAERFHSLKAISSHQAAEDLVYDFWYSIAELNSRGKLTYVGDTLASTIGMANVVRELNKGLYHYGHWLEDYVYGLLWIKQAPSNEPRSRTLNIPSWSWMNDQAPISYALLAGLKAASGPVSRGFPRILDSDHQSLESTTVWLSTLATLAIGWLLAFFQLFRSGATHSQTTFAQSEDDLLIRCVGLPDKISTIESTSPGSPWRISGYAVRATSVHSREREHFEYFWDYAEEAARLKVKDVTFMVVCPWQYNPQGDRRWAGLLLEKVGEDAETYERRGVFIGPSAEGQLAGWERQTINLI